MLRAAATPWRPEIGHDATGDRPGQLAAHAVERLAAVRWRDVAQAAAQVVHQLLQRGGLAPELRDAVFAAANLRVDVAERLRWLTECLHRGLLRLEKPRLGRDVIAVVRSDHLQLVEGEAV